MTFNYALVTSPFPFMFSFYIMNLIETATIKLRMVGDRWLEDDEKQLHKLELCLKMVAVRASFDVLLIKFWMFNFLCLFVLHFISWPLNRSLYRRHPLQTHDVKPSYRSAKLSWFNASRIIQSTCSCTRDVSFHFKKCERWKVSLV